MVKFPDALPRKLGSRVLPWGLIPFIIQDKSGDSLTHTDVWSPVNSSLFVEADKFYINSYNLLIFRAFYHPQTEIMSPPSASRRTEGE